MLGSVQGRTLQVTTKSDLYNEKKMQKRSITLVNVAATFASQYICMVEFCENFPTVVNGGVSHTDVGWCMDGCMGKISSQSEATGGALRHASEKFSPLRHHLGIVPVIQHLQVRVRSGAIEK